MPYTPLGFGIPGEFIRPTPKIEPWSAPTLLNSWVNFGAGEQTVRFRKDLEGVVYVQGVIKDGTTTANTPLFTLPVGYRPTGHLQIACASNNAYGQLKMMASGPALFRVGSATWFSFNFSFPT